MARPDFADVRLTAAGAKLAGDNEVRVLTARRDFRFKAGDVHNVERSYEWNLELKKKRANGEFLFEEVPAAATEGPAVPGSPAAAAVAAATAEVATPAAAVTEAAQQ